MKQTEAEPVLERIMQSKRRKAVYDSKASIERFFRNYKNAAFKRIN
jgi:hypothetical protein